jgi:hypothetical protein
MMKMQEADIDEHRKGRFPGLSYLLMWVGSLALMLLDIFAVRAAMLRIAAWYASSQITTTARRIEFNFRVNFVDRLLLFVMAVGALVGAIVLEHRFRHYAEEGLLLQKGWKSIAILAGIALISVGVLAVL